MLKLLQQAGFLIYIDSRVKADAGGAFCQYCSSAYRLVQSLLGLHTLLCGYRYPEGGASLSALPASIQAGPDPANPAKPCCMCGYSYPIGGALLSTLLASMQDGPEPHRLVQ